MTIEDAERRAVLRSAKIVGSATFLRVVIGVARTKAVAMLLGPTGVGLVGVYTAVVSAFSLAFGLGFDGSGTRRIAVIREEQGDRAAHRLATVILIASAALGLLGSALFVVAWVSGALVHAGVELDPANLALAAGIAITVVGAAGLGILTGRRDLAAIARVHVIGGLLATGLGIGCILLWGHRGLAPLVAFVALGPCLVAVWHVRPALATTVRKEVSTALGELFGLARLGVALTIAGVASAGSQVIARAMVLDELELGAVGLYQSAWGLSMTYVGVAMAGLTTDFYPRLATYHARSQARQSLMDQQITSGLILTAPLLVIIAAFAPLILRLLYSSDFTTAAPVLRWHALGDAIRLVSWPLGLVLLSAGRGMTYLGTELSWHGVYLVGLLALLPACGIEGTGYAYFAANLAFLLLQCVWLRHTEGLKLSSVAVARLGAMLCCIAAVIGTASWSELAGQTLGLMLAAVLAVPAAGMIFRR